MRKLLALATSAALTTVAVGALFASPAAAQCPGADGTVPGTAAKSVAVGPLYVDDRDFADVDDDGDAGGLWIYKESGKLANLQRGGDQIAFTVLKSKGVNPAVPYQGPVTIPAPAPVGPKTLFPSGIGGTDLATFAGSHDDCLQSTAANRDEIVF